MMKVNRLSVFIVLLLNLTAFACRSGGSSKNSNHKDNSTDKTQKEKDPEPQKEVKVAYTKITLKELESFERFSDEVHAQKKAGKIGLFFTRSASDAPPAPIDPITNEAVTWLRVSSEKSNAPTHDIYLTANLESPLVFDFEGRDYDLAGRLAGSFDLIAFGASARVIESHQGFMNMKTLIKADGQVLYPWSSFCGRTEAIVHQGESGEFWVVDRNGDVYGLDDLSEKGLTRLFREMSKDFQKMPQVLAGIPFLQAFKAFGNHDRIDIPKDAFKNAQETVMNEILRTYFRRIERSTKLDFHLVGKVATGFVLDIPN